MFKKIMAVMLAGVMSLCMLSACSSNDASKDTSDDTNGDISSNEGSGNDPQSLEAVKKAGVIKMFTNAAFPPYEYRKGEKIVGVDAEVANEIAKDIGVKLEITDIDFDSIIPAVKSGKASFGAAGMSVTEKRLKEIDFSVEYAKSRQYIITKSDKKYTKVSELGGLKIGTQTGTTGYILISDEIAKGSLKDKSKDSDLKAYKNALEATQDLIAGRIDAVVIDKLPAENIVASQKDKGIITNEILNADGSSTEEKYAICINKGNTTLLTAINTTLQRLLDEGKIDEYTSKHYELGSVE